MAAMQDDARAKQRTVWALGDYASVAEQVIPDLGAVLVRACGVRPGQRVLDVATGSGNAAIPAAEAGADVVGVDLCPPLLEAGRRSAAGRGVEIDWREGDAQALPFDDATFDVVLSSVGAMFAPDHRAVADELVRVCRPGGTVGLANWTPEGFVGQMFAAMKPYVAAPPPGAQPPPLWGDESHVRDLFADRLADLTMRRENVRVDCFGSAEEFRDLFKFNYGPTVAAYRALADDPPRVVALDEDLADLARHHHVDGAGMNWEYLLITGVRREVDQ